MLRYLAAPAFLAVAACSGGGETNQTVAANGAGEAVGIPAPAGTQWTETVAKTAEGGFRIGNPDAPVKLVEYLSLTCGVCADFAANGIPPLMQDWVRTGRASLEIRNYVRDPIDLTAAILSRCGGPAPYFQLTEQTLAEQHMIIERAQGISTEAQARIGQLPQAQQYAALAQELGLKDFYAQRGLGQQRADACLADPAALQELVDMQRTATEAGIQGTPAFLINGELQQVTNWRALEPLLAAAAN